MNKVLTVPSRRLFTLLILLGVVVLAFGAAPVAAQWSPMQRVSGYEDEAQTPYLVPDSSGTIHALNTRAFDGGFDITYRRWSPDQGWTLPVDVLVSARSGFAYLRGVVLDDEGYLHVIYYDGTEMGAEIMYSYAPAAEASNARAWAAPVAIGPWAGPQNHAALAADGDNLYVVYSGSRDGLGLYAVQSSDGGVTWSLPETIFLSFSDTLRPSVPVVYVDDSGTAHTFWGLPGSSGNSEAIYYSRYAPGDGRWSEAELMAEAFGYEANTPNVIEHEGELILVYHNDVPTTRWMRRSVDGGLTWTEPVRLFSHVGSNGPVNFVKDSSGQLHMFFGNRVGSPIIHGMWHTLWTGTGWSEPAAVVSGPRIEDDPGGEGFDPSFATAAVSLGNRLLLTWRSDPGAGPNGIWYTTRTLNAPAVEPVPLPQVQPAASGAAVKAAAAGAAEPVVEAAPADENGAVNLPDAARSADFLTQDSTATTLNALTAGLLATAAVLGLIILLRLFLRSRST